MGGTSFGLGICAERYAGKLFSYGSYATIPFGTDIKFALVIGNFEVCLFEWEAISTIGHLRIEFFEDESYTGGSPAALHNQRRGADNVAPLSVIEGVTSTPGSDPIMTRGMFSKAEGDHHDFVYEFDKIVFKPNTTYIVKASNLHNQDGNVYFDALFRKIKSLATS